MIKLFRNIRQSLLKEGKTTKYFKYAIGEIVLVVIGILIALQINNWNQQRIDRKNENYYLTQISLELKEDLVSLHQLKDNLQRNLPAIENLLAVLYDPTMDMISFNESVVQYMDVSWHPVDFRPNPATYEEMKSSGKLGIIQDKELRNKIVKLYSNLELTKNYIQVLGEFGVGKVIDLSIYKGFAKFMTLQKSTVSKYVSPEDLYELRKYKDDLINEAVNKNWDLFEANPKLDAQLNELELVVGEIYKTLNP